MSPKILGPNSKTPLRRLTPLHTTRATLPNHRLLLNIPGPPTSPLVANIIPDIHSLVEGVLYHLSPSDFQSLALSEGVLPFPTPLPLVTIQDIAVSTPHSIQPTPAKTFFFHPPPLPTFISASLRPSRTYVALALHAAYFHNLPPIYIRNVLRKIPVDNSPLSLLIPLPPRPHLLDHPSQTPLQQPHLFNPWLPSPTRPIRIFDHIARQQSNPASLYLVNLSSDTHPREKRKLYFIPGIDGTGKSLLSQVDAIDADGEWSLTAVVYPPANRQSIPQLASTILQLVIADAPTSPVSFIAESMGAVLAVELVLENVRRKRAAEPSLDIDFLLLINPATCYVRSDPRALWDFLISLPFTDLQYAALLPPVLLPFVLDLGSVRREIGPALVERLAKLLGALSTMADVLPRDALSHRLRLLKGYSVSERQLAQLGGQFAPSEVAVVSCLNDNLLPSLSENVRFQRCVPGIYSMILPFGGHVPTFDRRFRLTNFLRPFKKERLRSGNGKAQVVSEDILERRAAMRRRFGNRDRDEGNVASASHTNMQLLNDWLSEWTSRSSPVFIGEENLPSPSDGRPVLFVSNHTTLGWLDAMYPSYRMLSTKGIVLRSLAHPALFRAGQVGFPGVPTVSQETMRRFGVVTVSPTGLVEQLANGRWALLFPGGAKEALKGPGDTKYILKWPRRAEFIRPCALFGAVVVPVSTVGTEDMVTPVLDSETMATIIDRAGKLFGQPDMLQFFADDAKKWKLANGQKPEVIVPPLALPNGSDRIYFRFGKPMEMPVECLEDVGKEEEMYRRIQAEVEDGITVLLQRRRFDEYRSLRKREEFGKAFGDGIQPPAGPAWAWTRGEGAYLSDELQPPI